MDLRTPSVAMHGHPRDMCGIFPTSAKEFHLSGREFAEQPTDASLAHLKAFILLSPLWASRRVCVGV